ncbi:MAG: hypothetical protein KatS3mg082_0955 [Nitrospiraceae bacterium]|nr:MAG: hypothetical protein KatS3mg082_0955 [Nitrospiraceae bacterium]
MGVGGGETKTIGYTCRTGALKIFGQGFNSPRLHHAQLAVAGCQQDGSWQPDKRRSKCWTNPPLVRLTRGLFFD